MVKTIAETDSCRAYQCIKSLVSASHQSAIVKEKLLNDPLSWTWSVNWLADKMAENNETKSFAIYEDKYNSKSGGKKSASNEDAHIRTFQRTTSAQVTLDEANALLRGIDTGSLSDKEEEEAKPKLNQSTESNNMDIDL